MIATWKLIIVMHAPEEENNSRTSNYSLTILELDEHLFRSITDIYVHACVYA